MGNQLLHLGFPIKICDKKDVMNQIARNDTLIPFSICIGIHIASVLLLRVQPFKQSRTDIHMHSFHSRVSRKTASPHSCRTSQSYDSSKGYKAQANYIQSYAIPAIAVRALCRAPRNKDIVTYRRSRSRAPNVTRQRNLMHTINVPVGIVPNQEAKR